MKQLLYIFKAHAQSHQLLKRGHDEKLTHRETVANPGALRIDIMLRLTNQSTEMERPSFDRLFVRNRLFWSDSTGLRD